MKESKLRSALTAVIDLIWAGLLWLLCSLPIVTLGAASAALYYGVVKCIRHERGRLTASFFRAFRDNFRPATLLWLLCLGWLLLGWADLRAFQLMGVQKGDILYFMSRLFFLPVPLLFPWLFAFVSRFQNTVFGSLKFTAWLALRHAGTTLLLGAELGVFLLIVWLLPQLLPLLPGVFCLLMSFSIEPVFRVLTAEQGGDDPWYNE